MKQGCLEGTTNMWPAGLLLCNLTLHSINLPLFPTYTFKKEEGSLVKNALEELWKQPAREGESCSCGCSSPAEPQTTQISQGERVCECRTGGKCVRVCQDQRLQRTSHTLPEREGNTLSQEGVYPHALWTVEESTASDRSEYSSGGCRETMMCI